LEEGRGKILLDGTDIRKFKKENLRRVIGMVPQDNFLFSGTILENLYYGVEDDKDQMEINDKLLKISKFLGLHNFIKNMPDGYHTDLKENAANISVGQRQLIAFARVLMNDPQILILDEATSAVDPYTESLIQEALAKASVGRTTLVIAHRLSTVKNADEIYVLDDGEIVEQGNHESLMNKNGHYANLVEMQAQDIA
jgi:ATP-binding cassette subfamily B protein